MVVNPNRTANMCRETVSVGGTGQLTLGGAVAGFNTFSDYFVDSQPVSYWIEDGNDWENGIGTYVATGTKLTRSEILEKSVAGVVSKLPATGLTVSTSAVVGIRANAWNHIGGYSAGPQTGQFQIPHSIGRYNSDAGKGGGEFSAAAGAIALMPFVQFFPTKISQIGANITTLSAAGNFRMGIYQALPSGLPGELIIETGNISTGATGAVFETLGTPLLLPAGLYYAADAVDNVTAIASGIRTNDPDGGMINPFGVLAGLGDNGKARLAQTYGPFPQTWPTTGPTTLTWATFGIIFK